MPKITFIDFPEETLPSSAVPVPATNAAQGKLDAPYITVSEPKEFHFIKKLSPVLTALVSPKNLPINILALLLGRVSIMGEIAPFGLAFFAAIAIVNRNRALGVGLWAVAGILSAGNYWEGLIYGISMILYWRLSDKLRRVERTAQVIPLFFFGCMFLGGLIVSPWRDATPYGLVMVALNAAFCLALIYIFKLGLPLTLGDGKETENPADRLVCAVLMLAIGVAGLNGIIIMNYNVNYIVGSFVIMALVLAGGAGLGAAAGVLVGLVIGLNGGEAALYISMFALSGLLGGVFREIGKPAVILGFLLGNVICLLYFGQRNVLVTDLTPVLTESAIASVFFLLMRSGWVLKFQEGYLPAKLSLLPSEASVKPDSGKEELLRTAMDKLNYIAQLFSDLGETARVAGFNEQADYNSKIKDNQLSEMLSIIGNKVCDTCSYRSDCWDKEFYPIYQSLLEMLSLAETGQLTEKKVPLPLKSYCANKKVLVDLINQVVESNQVHWYWQKKLLDCRRAAAEQLMAAGSIIANLAQEIKREPRDDIEAALRLKRQAAELSCPLNMVRVAGNGSMVSVKVKKMPCAGTKECVNTILPLTANILKETMRLEHECGNKAKNKCCNLVMTLAERFCIEVGVAGASAGGSGRNFSEDVSGDASIHLKLPQGKEVLILSDGMGSGTQAAEQSGATIDYLRKLLTSGFDIDTAIKTVNSMLLVRASGESADSPGGHPSESFATVDMTIIDGYTCEAEFLKIGSAPSFIKRVREVWTVDSRSLPAGIVNQIEIEPVKRSLVSGDIIVMVSDGILEKGNAHVKESWVVNFLRRLNTQNPQEIATGILRQARTLNAGVNADDMTVLVARIDEKNVKT